jgi:DNA-binding response OmpR family regulator
MGWSLLIDQGEIMKILVVDDDRPSLKLISFLLREEGYVVSTAQNGQTALEIIQQRPPDLVILDVMMPHIDGFEVCHRIRKVAKIPIIFLSAKGQIEDRVMGLSIGADDYLAKPFEPAELLARVEAVLRRSGTFTDQQDAMPLRGGGLCLDPIRHVVFREEDGKEIELTPIEFRLLWCLMGNAGRVLSPSFLISKVWGYDYEGESNQVAVYIRRLRTKVEKEPYHPERLVTVRGHGYKFEPD